jgi:phage terminase large subunit-like protein
VNIPPGEGLARFCAFAEKFLTDEQSRPLVIEPWQRKLLGDYFDGTRELVVIVSKKNGKTSLFAALALWHCIPRSGRMGEIDPVTGRSNVD